MKWLLTTIFGQQWMFGRSKIGAQEALLQDQLALAYSTKTTDLLERFLAEIQNAALEVVIISPVSHMRGLHLKSTSTHSMRISQF